MTCVRAAPARRRDVTPCYKREFVLAFILSILAAARVFLRARSDTALEILALRQQVAVLKRKRTRPRRIQEDDPIENTAHRLTGPNSRPTFTSDFRTRLRCVTPSSGQLP